MGNRCQKGFRGIIQHPVLEEKKKIGLKTIPPDLAEIDHPAFEENSLHIKFQDIPQRYAVLFGKGDFNGDVKGEPGFKVSWGFGQGRDFNKGFRDIQGVAVGKIKFQAAAPARSFRVGGVLPGLSGGLGLLMEGLPVDGENSSPDHGGEV